MNFLKKIFRIFWGRDLQHSILIGDSLLRLKRHRLPIQSFISIGAGSGADSAYIHGTLCSEAQLLLIEAQDTHKDQLETLCAKNPAFRYILCAAAAEDGTVSFLASAPTGGAVSEAGTGVTLPSRSVDSLVKEKALSGPYFLKFDTHGVEVEILSGAKETLRNTQLIMMECYNFKLNFVNGKNLTFYEMCNFLEAQGFRCVDISDPLFRPNDLVFWQAQFYFIRSDHPSFNSNSYAAPAPSGV
jgi:FkbM family methyltransferase